MGVGDNIRLERRGYRNPVRTCFDSCFATSSLLETFAERSARILSLRTQGRLLPR